MILYLDSSALLRILLRESGSLNVAQLRSSESILSSELLAIECPRTLDRLRHSGSLMPEGIPFHTLPYEEILKRLRALTNLRIVPDKSSDTGYRAQIGPFPGWKTLPTW